MWITLSVLLVLIPSSCQAVHLQPCDSGYVEVVENQPVTLTCDQYSGAVKWSVRTPSSTSLTSIGICNATSCTVPGFPAYSLTYISAGSSTFTSTLTTRALGGTRYACSSSGDSESCLLHVVVNAVLSTPNLTISPPSSGGGWTVSGSVVINKIYSSRGLYKCVWSRKQENDAYTQLVSNNATIDTSTTTTQDKTGRCDITNSPLPSDTGTYTYRVIVSPGDTEKNDSSVVIATPSPPSITCNPNTTYVAENSSLQCTCSGEVGKPSGRLVWFYSNTAENYGGYGDTSLQLTRTVNKTDDGKTLRCDVNWVTDVTGPSHTIRVPYGPDEIIITGSSPFDTDGSQTLTLTCSIPQGSTPVPSFNWTRSTGPAVVHQQQTYTFQPQQSEDGIRVTCKARNTVSGVTATDTFTVDLNYPPTSDPVINTNSTGGHVYQGDMVTLTCGVTGGKPVNATSVTFSCPGKSDKLDVVGSTGVSSSVTFNPVTPNDHDKECTCTTRWKQTSWYNKNQSVKLFVNTPPSSPIIQVSSSEQYPYISDVKQTATLTCHSTTPGRPTANYTWLQTQGGQPANDSQGQATLTFATVSKDLDGKSVRCTARNRYTDNRQAVADGTLTLQVYYHPEVNLTQVTDTHPNECDLLTSDTPTCTLNEGQRVHFRCSANSNPAPAEVTWHTASSNGSDLLIPRVNHTQHTGVYNCSVVTGVGNHSDDPRLPLRGWRALTVLVKYQGFIDSFTLNSTQQNGTVNVSDSVTFICKSGGQPLPSMTLTDTRGEVIHSVSQGIPSLDNKVREISTNFTMRCRDTGVYRCGVSNGVGSAQEHNITVFVQCKPELPGSDDGSDGSDENEISVINFRTGAVQQSLSLVAYPTPQLRKVTYFTHRPNVTISGVTARDNLVKVTCHSGLLSSHVTCDLTLDNVTSQDAGFYRLSIGNQFGDLSYMFQVKVNATETKKPFPIAAVAGGLAAGLLVIIIIVVVIILCRCRKASKTNRYSNVEDRGRPDTEEPEEMDVNPDNGTSGEAAGVSNSTVRDDDNDGEMIINTLYESSGNIVPQGGRSNVPQDGSYEDVQIIGATPTIVSPPQTESPSSEAVDTSNVYATVNPNRRQEAVAGPSTPDTSNVYATVDKTKKKPKPPKKPKLNKGKGKGKGKKTKEEDGANDQETSLSVNPGFTASHGDYENFAFEGDQARTQEPDTANNDGADGQGSRTVNKDGLVYTTVGFTEEQRRKAEEEAPKRDNTDYAAIDFAAQTPRLL